MSRTRIDSPSGLRTRLQSHLGVFAFLVLTLPLAGAGCFTAPEACSDCNDGAGGSGAGGFHGSGGTRGSGGMLGTGGSTTSSGGSDGGVSTGGTGMGGSNTGGKGAGGSGMGGAGIGGAGTGGSGMGGASMGGSGMGGSGMGGSGIGGAGMGGSGAGGAIDVALVAWYKFDDGSGTTAADSSGHSRNATLSAVGGGAAAFSTTTHQVGTGSLNLSSGGQGNGGLLTLPASLPTMGATTAITIACWINLRTNRGWERIFDFGNGMTTGYMFLTNEQVQNTPSSVRFAISTAGNSAEQMINMAAPAVLSTGVWHHVAVTLGTGSPYTGTLYIDKAVAGTNSAMTVRPSSLGNTPNNWIGQSQFAVDPLFDGFIDDFRIYSRALSAAEIAALP